MAIAIAAISALLVLQAQEDFDDIYYNPKKGSNQSVKSKNSHIIMSFSGTWMTITNRRGFYYNSPVDTIGMSAEAEPDLYTPSRFRNIGWSIPPSSLITAHASADVLENSYGNVDIIINDFDSFFRASVHESMADRVNHGTLGLGTYGHGELGTVMGMDWGPFVGMEPSWN